MATIILKLDTRRANAKGQYPIQLQLSHNSKSTSISVGISVKSEFWIGEINKAVAAQCPNAKQLNSDIEAIYFKYSNALRSLDVYGKIQGMTLADIRKSITQVGGVTKKTTFSDYFELFISRKERESTANIYRHTLSKVIQFAGKSGHPANWDFEEITHDWLNRLERFLKLQHIDDDGNEIESVCRLKTNGIAIHFRNIRAVVNAAIDEDVTSIYPFRKFKIKHEETIKRSLTIDNLRTLRDYECEKHQEKYRDLFLLIFYLIGINTIDIFNIKEVNNGRIEFRRSKTGRLFSIKVEPEAQAIIDKYRGKGQLLDVLDTYINYKDFAHRMNQALHQIGTVERKGRGGKKIREPLFPQLTTYWARHTWATVAAELDVPDETISLALGHSTGNRVTNIYINRNQKKVDAANRKVIDYLNSKTDEKAPAE